MTTNFDTEGIKFYGYGNPDRVIIAACLLKIVTHGRVLFAFLVFLSSDLLFALTYTICPLPRLLILDCQRKRPLMAESRALKVHTDT